MDILLREDARATGQVKYFTGVACRHGHIAERYVIGNTCCICHVKNVQRWQDQNHDTYLASARKGRRKYLGYPKPPYDPPGHCEICLSPDSGKNDWNLDHIHATHQFRGWLCSRCNGGLGMFKDDPELLEKAIAYLRKPRS